MSAPLKFATLILCALLAGCASPGSLEAPLPPTATSTPSLPTPTPAPYPVVATPAPPPTPIPDSGWQSLRPGLEERVLNLLDAQGKRLERLTLLRLQPDQFTFQVNYKPQPQTLAEWQAETGALLVVNGGYFREDGDIFIPTGLSVVDGKPMGSSYGSFAGMFAVTSAGPDLRWLAEQPYDPGEPLLSALQSFPLLIKPGGELGFPAENEDNEAARRTLVARDRAGSFLFIVAQQGYFTLHTLSKFLAESDLELDIALNLDGGPSTGLLLSDPALEIPSFAPLPVVISVLAR